MPENTDRQNIRASKNTAKDRRIIKTKKILKQALYDMLREEKDLTSISVTSLCQKADINRSTFYFYYKDIFDMMEQIQNEIYNTFEKDIVKTDLKFENVNDYYIYITKILDYCKNNAEDCKFIIENDCNKKLENKIRDAIYSQIPDSKGAFDESDPRYYLTTFALNAIKGTIIQWLNDGMKVSTEKMTKFLAMTYVFGGLKIKTQAIKI